MGSLFSFSFLRSPHHNCAIGFVNSTLYTGDIEYIDVPTSTNSYWILPITGMLGSVSVYNR
jgi:hypothetical protein